MKRIYLDLDSLLDTRLGLLNQHAGTKVSKAVAQSEAYYCRDHDNWTHLTNGVVSNETFAQWWEARGNTTLRHSMTTSILLSLIAVLETVSDHVHEGIEEQRLSLLINTWPYTLDPTVERALSEAIVYHLGFELPIVYIHMNMKELTPRYLSECVHLVYMYDFHPWFRHHSWEIIKLVQSGLSFTLPRRFEKDVGELTQAEKQKSLLAFDLATRLHITCVFIETRYFSLFTPEVLARFNPEGVDEVTTETPSP